MADDDGEAWTDWSIPGRYWQFARLKTDELAEWSNHYPELVRRKFVVPIYPDRYGRWVYSIRLPFKFTLADGKALRAAVEAADALKSSERGGYEFKFKVDDQASQIFRKIIIDGLAGSFSAKPPLLSRLKKP